MTNPWTRAIDTLLSEQVFYGTFNDDGELLITPDDDLEAFRVMARELPASDLLEWVTDATAGTAEEELLHSLITSIVAPDRAQERLQRALGRSLLLQYRDQIEARRVQLEDSWAKDLFVDLQIDRIRESEDL